MYLSQLTLNPRNRRVMSERADPYQMHRTLAHAWQEYTLAHPLYRVDETPDGNIILLVQSCLEPDWSFLDRTGYLLKSAASKMFEPRLEAGQVLSFRLRANPTRCQGHPRGEIRKRGKRVGIFKEDERRDWLLRRADQHGFSIPVVGQSEDGTPVHDFRLTDEKALHASPEGLHKQAQAVLSAALFEGRLTVNDPDEFSQALQNGIGPAKAFGFGLLSLRRA